MSVVNPIYSRTAAGRIMGLQWFEVEILAIQQTDVLVETKAGRFTIEKQQFRDDFVQYRKDGAKTLIATREDENSWIVKNPERGSYSSVNIVNGIPLCSCEDYASHGKACKHIYAVLNQMGFDSLRDYTLSQGER